MSAAIEYMKMEGILEKIDTFGQEVKSQLVMLLNDKQATITRLRFENERLRDMNRRLNTENKNLCTLSNVPRTGDFATVPVDVLLSSLAQSSNITPPSRPSKAVTVTRIRTEPKLPANDIIYLPYGSSADSTGSKRSYDQAISEPEECSIGLTDMGLQAVAVIPDWKVSPFHKICKYCNDSPADPDISEYDLCTSCYTWQHLYCVKTTSEVGDDYCVYCALLDAKQMSKEIRMESRPKGAENFPSNCTFYWNFIMRSGKVIKVGDCVYLPRTDNIGIHGSTVPIKGQRKGNCDIFRITRLYKDKDGDKVMFGFHYFRASQTMYKANKRFFSNEVFEVTTYDGTASLRDIRGFCAVLRLTDYVKGRPRFVDPADVYIVEQGYFCGSRKQYKYQKTENGKRKSIPVDGARLPVSKYDKLKLPHAFPVFTEDCSFEQKPLVGRQFPTRLFYYEDGMMKREKGARAKTTVRKVSKN